MTSTGTSNPMGLGSSMGTTGYSTTHGSYSSPSGTPGATTPSYGQPSGTETMGERSSSRMEGTTGTGERKNLMILGATGTTGKASVMEIAEKFHHKFRLFVGIHESTPTDDKWLDSVDICRRCDADSLGSLDFSDIDYLFIIPSNAENRVEQVRHYVQAARKSGVKYILLLSVLAPSAQTQTLFARQFTEMENLVSESGIPCTFLRTTFFQQNLLAHAEEMRTRHSLSLPIRQGKCAPLHVRDLARAAAALLANPEKHIGKAYNLVGPEVLDGEGIAKAASRALGREVRFVDVEPERFLEMYENQGIPKWLARGFSEILDLVASNQLANYETKSFYEELTNYRGTTVEEFFREHYYYFSEMGPGAGMGGAGVSAMGMGRGSGMGGMGGMGGGYGSEEQMNVLADLIREMVMAQEAMVRTKRDTIGRSEGRLNKIMNLHRRFESLRQGGGQGRQYGGQGFEGERYGREGRSTGMFGRGYDSDRWGREDSGRYGRGSGLLGRSQESNRWGRDESDRYGRSSGLFGGKNYDSDRWGRDEGDRYGRSSGLFGGRGYESDRWGRDEGDRYGKSSGLFGGKSYDNDRWGRDEGDRYGRSSGLFGSKSYDNDRWGRDPDRHGKSSGLFGSKSYDNDRWERDEGDRYGRGYDNQRYSTDRRGGSSSNMYSGNRQDESGISGL